MRSFDILLVEDSVVDAKLLTKVFEKLHVSHKIYVVSDGAAALEFLEKSGPGNEWPQPDLILLDLNLPKIDGRGVLKVVKTSPLWRSIPTIILSTSDNLDDVRDCYNLQANAYIIKPDRLETLLETAKAIESFWLTSAKLPSRALA